MIAFDNEKGMVNATDMLKAYPDKRMTDYLRLKQTKILKNALESKTGNPVLTVKHGGSGHGTWMSKLMALDFAAWLNVDFRIFIYETFENTLREKFRLQQAQLDRLYDRDDNDRLYSKW